MYIRYLENGKHSSFMDDMKKTPLFGFSYIRKYYCSKGFPYQRMKVPTIASQSNELSCIAMQQTSNARNYVPTNH